MKQKIIQLERENLTNLLKKIEEYKIIYLSANIGCGKTFEVQRLEEKTKQKFTWYNIKKEDNANKYFIDNIDERIKKENKKIQVIVIDNLYLLNNKEQRNKLAKYIEETDENIHFFICTRNVLTPEYRKFLVEDKLLLITNKELDLKPSDIKQLFKQNNVQITEEQIKNIVIKKTYRICSRNYISIK